MAGTDHTLATTNDDMMARVDVMHLCGVCRSTQGKQQAKGQDGTHRFCSIDKTRLAPEANFTKQIARVVFNYGFSPYQWRQETVMTKALRALCAPVAGDP